MNDRLKGVLLWVISIGGLAVLAMGIQWWIATNVSSQLAAAGLVPKSDITAINNRIDTANGRIDALEKLHEKDVTRVEDKAERIAQILMEE